MRIFITCGKKSYVLCVSSTDGAESDVFHARLAQTVAVSGLSRSAFAEAAGIDRTTLSQVLSAGSGRFPRVETLVAMARYAQVSVDWLLGLSEGEPIRADIVVEQLRIEGTAPPPNDHLLAQWLAEAVGSKVRYIPTTVPDLLKTDAVIRHEVGRYDVTSPEQKIESASMRLEWTRRLGTDMECVNSVQAVEGFARGEGIWRTLDRRRRVHQLNHMIDLLDELYPALRWFLIDGRERYAAPVTVFGTHRAALYLGNQYFVFTAEEPVHALVRSFDDLVRSAAVQPTDVARLLARLRDEIA